MAWKGGGRRQGRRPVRSCLLVGGRPAGFHRATCRCTGVEFSRAPLGGASDATTTPPCAGPRGRRHLHGVAVLHLAAAGCSSASGSCRFFWIARFERAGAIGRVVARRRPAIRAPRRRARCAILRSASSFCRRAELDVDDATHLRALAGGGTGRSRRARFRNSGPEVARAPSSITSSSRHVRRPRPRPRPRGYVARRGSRS